MTLTSGKTILLKDFLLSGGSSGGAPQSATEYIWGMSYTTHYNFARLLPKVIVNLDGVITTQASGEKKEQISARIKWQTNDGAAKREIPFVNCEHE